MPFHPGRDLIAQAKIFDVKLSIMQNNLKYKNLKTKLEERNRSLKERIVNKHQEAFFWAQNNTKQLAAGAMGSLMLLAAPSSNYLPKPSESSISAQFVDISENMFVVSDIKKYLPDTVSELLPQQEEKISEILSNYYGFSVKPDINGLRLNRTYGYIGLEQHLKRYPGDNIDEHFQTDFEANQYRSSGLAPGLGGFGYFAHSKSELTQQDIDREKYYIAVQSFLSPGFSERTREYINFFRYRKMLLVNPNSGRAIVVVIGDAGPAVWTGKQLGGSPEVMSHLERVDGRARGAVLYFFIDDPEDKIPLGPIEPKQ